MDFEFVLELMRTVSIIINHQGFNARICVRCHLQQALPILIAACHIFWTDALPLVTSSSGDVRTGMV